MYKVKEIHYTIQGEGAQTGRPAVFIRFSGCNLWSGREEDRATAICRFCDTDFWGMDGHLGGKYTATELTELVLKLWPEDSCTSPYVVFTGGEPALQLDTALLDVLSSTRFSLPSKQTAHLYFPEASTGSVCPQKQIQRLSPHQAMRSRSSSPRKASIRLILRTWILIISFCNRWTGNPWPRTPEQQLNIAGVTLNGG